VRPCAYTERIAFLREEGEGGENMYISSWGGRRVSRGETISGRESTASPAAIKKEKNGSFIIFHGIKEGDVPAIANRRQRKSVGCGSFPEKEAGHSSGREKTGEKEYDLYPSADVQA